MASENPPTAPAASAHRMLVRDGKAPCSPSAIESIRAKAQACEKAERTNASARREPYPPAKSDAPQRNTATTLQAAGANWGSDDMPDEISTTELGRRAPRCATQYFFSAC